jgi:hypothetical protein
MAGEKRTLHEAARMSRRTGGKRAEERMVAARTIFIDPGAIAKGALAGALLFGAPTAYFHRNEINAYAFPACNERQNIGEQTEAVTAAFLTSVENNFDAMRAAREFEIRTRTCPAEAFLSYEPPAGHATDSILPEYVVEPASAEELYTSDRP